MRLLIPETLAETARRLEHYETPEWAVKAILQREAMTNPVIDPCTGTGVLAKAAQDAGYDVFASDIHDWGFPLDLRADWLAPSLILDRHTEGGTVLMNPPFSRAVDFVDMALWRGAESILCFQRFAWWESRERRAFWDKHPPLRVYICGDRASCWRHDLPKDAAGNRFDPATGKKLRGTTTAHAWFVWGPPGTLDGTTMLHRLYRDEAAA